jgi:DNA-binding HxlR family transcriptional regulator
LEEYHSHMAQNPDTVIPGSQEGRAAFCPSYTHAVEVIGRRWTGAILRSMLAGRTRFTEIRADIPELSDRLLSQRLKELESEGIVIRQVTPSTPVRVDYALTDKGRSLGAVVDAVIDWAETWAPGAS